MSNKVSNEAPVIPHITANIIPLSHILKNYSEDAYKELAELLQTLQSQSVPDIEKKRNLLLLLVKLRENFIRLYVLNKWSVNSVQFTKLIDLLNWLRLTIEQVSLHSIFGLKNLNLSLTSAKLPNPDLTTSLEVLLSGRPQLPSYNFLPRPKLSSQTILKTLKNLNITLALRLSLLDELPLNFYQYQIKDGRVYFNVEKNFQCCLSLADDSNDHSQFFLIDFKFNFKFKDNSILYDQETCLYKSHHRLETIANQILSNNRTNLNGGLTELNKILTNYTLNYKLFLLHRQLISIRMSYWKSQISHTYSADKNLIIINYWLKLQQQPNKKRKISSYVEISISNQTSIQLKWVKDNEVCEIIEDFDLKSDELNIENVLNSILEKHVNLKIQLLYQQISQISPQSIQLKPSSASSPTLSLIIQLTSTKNINLSISPLSGLLYFVNPTPLLSSLLPQLNAYLSNDPSRLHLQILSIILKTNIELLNSLMNSTDWLLNNIKISNVSKIIPQKLDDELMSLKYYRRSDWPQGWFLISSLIIDETSSPLHINWYVAKIKLFLGSWNIEWFEELKLNQQNENIYKSLEELSTSSRSKLLSQLITEDLENNSAKLKILDSKFKLPFEIKENDGPIISVKNSSMFKIINCHENLFIKVELNHLNGLKISIIGKLKNFKINELHDESAMDLHKTTLDYSPATDVFEIKSFIDGSIPSSTNTEITTESIISSSNQPQSPKTSILKSSLELLNRFSKMLKILNLLTKESISILSNNLSQIEISYFETEAVLDISQDSLRFEFDLKNPHSLLDSQIDDFLQSYGLLKTLRLLKLTYPIVSKLSSLDFNTALIDLNHYRIVVNNFTLNVNVNFAKKRVSVDLDPSDLKSLQRIKSSFPNEKFLKNLMIFDLSSFEKNVEKLCILLQNNN